MPFSSRTSDKRSVAASRAAFGRVGRAGALLRLRRRSRVRGVYGARKINETEAVTVRRILTEFAAGRSPRAIALQLNAERLPGPHGKPWGPSTIYGNWRRGTGLLNNELYIGRLIWNRQRFANDPSTGKRQGAAEPARGLGHPRRLRTSPHRGCALERLLGASKAHPSTSHATPS